MHFNVWEYDVTKLQKSRFLNIPFENYKPEYLISMRSLWNLTYWVHKWHKRYC